MPSGIFQGRPQLGRGRPSFLLEGLVMKKSEIWDKKNVFLYRNSDIAPYIECSVDSKRLDYVISLVASKKKIAGIDRRGIHQLKEDLEDDGHENFDLPTVERVAKMLVQYSALFDFRINQFKRSRYWRDSYGLKHAFESFSKRLGHDPYYVANGDFIAAYLLFLHDMQGASQEELNRCIITNDWSLNAGIRLPASFDKFETAIRNPNWF